MTQKNEHASFYSVLFERCSIDVIGVEQKLEENMKESAQNAEKLNCMAHAMKFNIKILKNDKSRHVSDDSKVQISRGHLIVRK